MKEKGEFAFTLDKSIGVFEEIPGIFVRDLKAGDVVTLETNNTYYLVFLDSEGNVIMMSDGPHLKKPFQTHVWGATLGGSILKIDHILLGCPLEFKGPFRITKVRSIFLNGKKLIIPSSKTIQ